MYPKLNVYWYNTQYILDSKINILQDLKAIIDQPIINRLNHVSRMWVSPTCATRADRLDRAVGSPHMRAAPRSSPRTCATPAHRFDRAVGSAHIRVAVRSSRSPTRARVWATPVKPPLTLSARLQSRPHHRRHWRRLAAVPSAHHQRCCLRLAFRLT